MSVDEVMTRDVLTLAPDTSLEAARTFLLAHRISGAPVVDGRRVLGVISESDLAAGSGRAATVAGAMTEAPVTAEPSLSLWAAADLMAAHSVNRLPVVDDDGALVGIVTRGDLIRAFARSDEDIERELREMLLPWAGVEPYDPLEVHVERGVVTVTGEILSDLGQHSLRHSIHLVPGVVRVEWHVAAPLGVG
jgi:predicted transcriptional regulator